MTLEEEGQRRRDYEYASQFSANTLRCRHPKYYAKCQPWIELLCNCVDILPLDLAFDLVICAIFHKVEAKPKLD